MRLFLLVAAVSSHPMWVCVILSHGSLTLQQPAGAGQAADLMAGCGTTPTAHTQQQLANSLN